MSQLLRIILLHTHLPGVVEIKLDEHTNICGTNASGKTTLQRLIPVFYGEQPNRVVPKTRKKFDQFYLPYTNSYIIYEYQRENGELSHVALTPKNTGGVDYRFIGAPYQSELYLQHTEQGVQALLHSEWTARLRTLGETPVSPKLGATSEYRSIIQNDVASGDADSLRLRRLAATFGLVGRSHKLRHIEKLVSAVHSKEGKMDTLKSMLAAIFAEDGVTLPTTKVRNTKAREWILQMRQSMRLESLQQDFERLQGLARQLDGTDAQLGALEPLLKLDHEQQSRERADAEQQVHRLQGEMQSLKEQFTVAEQAQNSELSKTQADLDETSTRLDQLQTQYDGYADRDMNQLQQDTDALPQWRETLQELAENYQLMVAQHVDLEHQLERRKAKLAESFNRLSEQHRHKAKTIRQQKEQTREQQNDKQDSLELAYQQRLQAQQQHFSEQLSAGRARIAVLQSKLEQSPLSDAEHDALRESELRLEQAQQHVREQMQQLQRTQQQWQQARLQCDKADQQLEHCRKALHQVDHQLQKLHQQLSPEQGSLRHFLRLHRQGWEQQLGKVLDEQLLDRHDLYPEFGELTDSLYGLVLDLKAVDVPDYAQDEAAVSHRIQSMQQQQAKARADKEQSEKALKNSHEQAELLRAEVEQAKWQTTQSEQDIDYARDARDRLQQEQRELVKQRQQLLRAELNREQQQLDAVTLQQQQDVEALQADHQSQKLELKADWQAELQVFDEQLEALELQLERKREDHSDQIKQLEQAFNEELSEKGIDPGRLAGLRERQARLKNDIKQVENRQDDLKRWHDFMQVDWQQRRPTLLAQEAELKQLQRTVSQTLSRLKSDFTHQRKQLDTQKSVQQKQVQQAGQQLEQLKPLLVKLEAIDLTPTPPVDGLVCADLTERLSRTNEALAQRSHLDGQLKTRLEQFENGLSRDAGSEFLDRLDYEKSQLGDDLSARRQLPILADLLHILQDQQLQLLEMGENIGGDLKKFFTVFSDINRRIADQSRRLSDAVADDLVLEGIRKADVQIASTIDELGFWQPLKRFAKLYDNWGASGKALPSEAYLNALADVVELLRADQNYSIESLLRLELHLSEGGSELVIKNDRQLLESSSHGMAYLILCKYLLAFTRLLRGPADVAIHWPIDEIGTLAYHNVEKLFEACTSNQIRIVGAFPNPESDVLMLFTHRYLIEASQSDPGKRQLKRIQPKISRLAKRLAHRQPESAQ
ncbi:MAG: hypothetical protein CENE_01646 [Candidatus Celerinatantimonas neptuna]|nr:MAG: hypothetical protein CENE_01646 [Candidatus Celerinatantimonas neptuna]